jgi:hypothetical protein
MYQSSSAGSTITLNTVNTFYGWTTSATGSMKYVSFTTNATANRINILNGGAGDYMVNFNGTMSFNTTALYTVSIFKNGVQQTKLTTFVEPYPTSYYFTPSINGFLQGLVTGDYLDVRFSGGTAGITLTVYYGSLTITKL